MNPSVLFNIIEDKFIENLLDFIVISTIDSKNAAQDIAGVIYALVNRLLSFYFLLVLVPLFSVGVE